MLFALSLLEDGIISTDDFIRVVRKQISVRPPVGRLALRTRMLTIKEVQQILAAQADRPEPFGEIGRSLGLLTDIDVAVLLFQQVTETPSIEELLVEEGVLSAEEVERAQRKAALV